MYSLHQCGNEDQPDLAISSVYISKIVRNQNMFSFVGYTEVFQILARLDDG